MYGTSLRLDFIEGNPDNNKVKVFPLVIAAMTIYAEALGANELRVMNPINEDIKNLAVRRYCDPDLLNSVEEPKGLISGKINASGEFVVNEGDSEKNDNDEQK